MIVSGTTTSAIGIARRGTSSAFTVERTMPSAPALENRRPRCRPSFGKVLTFTGETFFHGSTSRRAALSSETMRIERPVGRTWSFVATGLSLAVLGLVALDGHASGAMYA